MYSTHLPDQTEPRHVALLVESSLNSGRLLLRGIAEYVRTSPWSIYYEPAHIQNTLPEWLKNWQGDGIIARVRNKTLAAQLLKMKVPVVDILGDIPDTNIPSVQVDNVAIAKLAANHLIEHGFREFAYCGIRGRNWSKIRLEAFQTVLANSGYACHRYQLPSFYSKSWSSDTEREKLAAWIDGLPKPVGIMTTNDWSGLKVLNACRHLGVMVPEEVAVIGVDNDHAICEIANPMLSSIATKHERVGFHAAKLLDALMRGETPPEEPLTVGVPSIVSRRSTDIQTIDDKDVVAAIQFIRENACHKIQVEDVAKHVALSYSTLKRRFHRVLSRTVHEEIMRVRIGRIRELLTETEMTLSEIAHATGFEHQEYFGAVFKSSTGMTPKEFRAATKKTIL